MGDPISSETCNCNYQACSLLISNLRCYFVYTHAVSRNLAPLSHLAHLWLFVICSEQAGYCLRLEMNRLHLESWQERSPGVAEKTWTLPKFRYLSPLTCQKSRCVCGHKRCQVVAEPLKGVYTGVKWGCPRQKAFSAAKQSVDIIYKSRGQLSQQICNTASCS